MTSATRDAFPELTSLEINVSILEGRDLVIKDKNMFGKGGSSDPYVKLYVNGVKNRRTKTIQKNLNPKWNSSFKVEFKSKAANTIARGGKCLLQFYVFDEDILSSDDPMGTVEINLNWKDPESTKWYTIGTGKGSHYCKKAKGELKLKIGTVAKKVPSMIPGNSLPLPGGHVRIGLGWDLEYGQIIDLDSSCVAVGRNGNILMDETVYYGDLVNSNGSIRHSGDERTGAGNIQGSGDDEIIDIYLDQVSYQVAALYLILTVATPGKTLADVRSARVSITDMSSQSCLGNFIPSLLGNNSALFLARLSRDLQQSRGWKFTIIGEPDVTARDFGSLIPEIKGYTRDIIPSINIEKNERIAMLRKGGTVRLRDYTPNRSDPPSLTMGLAWDITNGRNVDLDASAICLDSSLNVIDIVYFKHLKSNDGTIIHHGDEREGDEKGDDEKITVHLGRVHQAMAHIAFVVTSYTGQELDDVKKASCHLFDPYTKMDIAKYKLSKAKELDKHTGLLMGVLSRDPSQGWLFRIISQPAQGRVPKKLIPVLQQNLARFPTLTPIIPPDPDIIVNVMPQNVAMNDQDIIVDPSQFNVSNQPHSNNQGGPPYNQGTTPYNQAPPYNQGAPPYIQGAQFNQPPSYNHGAPYHPAAPNQAPPYNPTRPNNHGPPSDHMANLRM